MKPTIMYQTKYRVVKDDYAGFEVQSKRWWFPFWVICNGWGLANTHKSVEDAKEFIKKKKSGYFKKRVFYQE